MSWNKGSQFLINCINDTNYILNRYKPHILTLSEAQVKPIHESKILFEKYNIEYDNLLHNNKMARSCMLVHEDIRYERLKDSEPDFTSVIAIKVGLKHCKKFVVIQWYRQWQLLNSIDTESHTTEKQRERINKVMNKWSKLTDNNEINKTGSKKV